MSEVRETDGERRRLAELAEQAAVDPAAAEAEVVRLSAVVPEGTRALFFEDACRIFLAAGERDRAGRMFTQACQADHDVESPARLDRLHQVFGEFAPTGVIAPADFHDHAETLALNLPPRQALARFREVIGAALNAGVAPYAEVFADLRGLAEAARVEPAAEDEYLAERLLRAGTLAGSPPAVWAAAGQALTALARREPGSLDALIASEPAGEPEETARARPLWLALLADAEAGRVLPPDWFSAAGGRCPADTLRRLVEQAAERLFPPPPPAPRPAAAPVLDDARPAAWPQRERSGEDSPRWYPDTDFAALAAGANASDMRRDLFLAKLTAFVRDLGYFANIDYPATLRALWTAPPPIPELLRELAYGWREQAGTGGLPVLETALAYLAPLSNTEFTDLDESFTEGWQVADPAAALTATLRQGIPAELAFPAFGERFVLHGYPVRNGDPVQVVQHGGFLTVSALDVVKVFTPDGDSFHVELPAQRSGQQLFWYDGDTMRVSRRRRTWDGWQTFRLDGVTGEGEGLLTLDAGTRTFRPDYPETAEVVFPGATGPTAVSCVRGRLCFHSPDGTVTAQAPFGTVQKLPAYAPPVPPPGWWPHLSPVDPAGSAALRGIGPALAAELAEAALQGPRTALERVEELLPEITAPVLREAVAAEAGTAARCWTQIARLRLGRPPSPPAVLITRPDLPVGKNLARVAQSRLLAGLLESAAQGPDVTRPELVRIAEIPGDERRPWLPFRSTGNDVLAIVWPWVPEYDRRNELDRLRAWVSTPFGDASGRWRHLTLASTIPRSYGYRPAGEVWRTPHGALIIISYHDREATAVDHAPDKRFDTVELPGWAQASTVPQGWGGADRIVALERLIAERGPVPARPAFAVELAERTGLTLWDAAGTCFGRVLNERALQSRPAEISAQYLDLRTGTLAEPKLSYPDQDRMREELMPDDPADLWTTGPTIDRAATWWNTRR